MIIRGELSLVGGEGMELSMELSSCDEVVEEAPDCRTSEAGYFSPPCYYAPSFEPVVLDFYTNCLRGSAIIGIAPPGGLEATGCVTYKLDLSFFDEI